MFTLVLVNLVIILSKMSLQAMMVQHDLTGILLSQNKNKADSNSTTDKTKMLLQGVPKKCQLLATFYL